MARGDGAAYRVRVFTASGGQTGATRTFTAGPEWQAHVFRRADFGITGRDVTRISIVAGPAPGQYELLLDDTEVR